MTNRWFLLVIIEVTVLVLLVVVVVIAVSSSSKRRRNSRKSGSSTKIILVSSWNHLDVVCYMAGGFWWDGLTHHGGGDASQTSMCQCTQQEPWEQSNVSHTVYELPWPWRKVWGIRGMEPYLNVMRHFNQTFCLLLHLFVIFMFLI